MLRNCESISKYIMVDPWRNLSDWNKPANKDNSMFETFYKETLRRTNFSRNKRDILRGRTTEVINDVENDSLDFIYIDGDHTLKGITIDLINIWSKVNSTGFIAGDDFNRTIWQHSREFEPTFVFPFAVYFAEAKNTNIYGLPYEQFLISKEANGFEFIDLTNGKYQSTELRHQFLNTDKNKNNLKSKIANKFSSLYNVFKK